MWALSTTAVDDEEEAAADIRTERRRRRLWERVGEERAPMCRLSEECVPSVCRCAAVIGAMNALACETASADWPVIASEWAWEIGPLVF